MAENRYRDRSNSRDRDNSGNIVTGIEVEIEEDQTQGRIENNQQRSGSGQRYYEREDICYYCNRTGLFNT